MPASVLDNAEAARLAGVTEEWIVRRTGIHERRVAGPDEGTAALVPVGTGILLLGGRGNRVENNRIYGNFLAGVAAAESILVTKNPEARALQRNIVRNNQFGLNGTDPNGVDLMYDGNGTDNCFSLEGVTSTFPADRSTFGVCSGANPFRADVQQQMIGFIGENAVKAWKKHEHPPKRGYTPLEVFGG